MPKVSKVAAIIPARWGSTRFPGKPLHLIAGKPLIQHVWERCRRASALDEIVIATDDLRIAEAAFAFGAEVALTSNHHLSGTDRIEWTGRPERVETAALLGESTALEVFRLYWVTGYITSNQYAAKALQAWSKLSGRGDDAALVVMYAPKRGHDDDPGVSLRAFARAMSPSIERALAAASESRP